MIHPFIPCLNKLRIRANCNNRLLRFRAPHSAASQKSEFSMMTRLGRVLFLKNNALYYRSLKKFSKTETKGWFHLELAFCLTLQLRNNKKRLWVKALIFRTVDIVTVKGKSTIIHMSAVIPLWFRCKSLYIIGTKEKAKWIHNKWREKNRISKTSVPLIFTQELTLLFLKTKIIYIFQKKPSTTRHFFRMQTILHLIRRG